MTQPKLITKPFADDALPGYVNEIPKENPVGAPEQNASWSVGFPPITMTDINDGGLPPNGEDMNGILRAITEHNLFIGGGGVYEFTDEYITEVGGYSKGAVLVSDDKTALWMSIQDNNTQNFNGATKTQWRRIAFTELDSTLTSIQNALNTKADKSVTITAGDGLVGGGTLAGDRVISVNSSVVRTDRTITAGTGLSGGGNLSANRTLSVNYGTTADTAAQGNDPRLVNAILKSMLAQEQGLASDVPMSQSAVTTFVNHQFGMLQLYIDYSFINNERVKQVTGTSESDLMSQKAVTDELSNKVGLSGNQTIAGIKTFSSFPVTPSAAPTDNYQAANKKYVDDNSIGVGQTWQDVKGSRLNGVTYTNSTGRPIQVNVHIAAGSAVASGSATFYVDGKAFDSNSSTSHSWDLTVSAVIGNGSTYSATWTGGAILLRSWMELR